MTVYNSPTGIIILRFSDGKFIDVNAEFLELYGYSREEIIGQTPYDLGLWAEPDYSKHMMASLFHKGVVQNFETQSKKKSGEDITLIVSMYTTEINGELCMFGLIMGASAQNTAVGSMQTDDNKNGVYANTSEERLSLLASAQEFAELHNHAAFGYHATDADGTFLVINASESAWLGYPQEELIGNMKLADFYTPAHQGLIKKDFLLALENETIIEKEYDLVSRGGAIKRVIQNITTIRGKDGQFLHSQAVVHDITEQKHTQDNLKRITAKQQEMLDNQLVGIVKTRDLHVITWKNSAIERIFGYDSGDLYGKSTRILFADDTTYLSMAKNAYPLIKAEGIYRAQLEMIRKDGGMVWVDVSGMHLNDQEILWMLTDISNIKKYQDDIEHIAFHDALTGLPNRRLVSDRLIQVLAQAKRTNELLAVCYLDLDGFKPINDKFGHDVGDTLLREVTRRMQDTVRINDTVGRLGGDEFVLLLTNLTDVVEFQIALERILDAINKPIDLAESCQVTVGASIGVALFPRDSDDADILLRYADHAMYQAKRAGRNRVHLYSTDNIDAI